MGRVLGKEKEMEKVLWEHFGFVRFGPGLIESQKICTIFSLRQDSLCIRLMFMTDGVTSRQAHSIISM